MYIYIYIDSRLSKRCVGSLCLWPIAHICSHLRHYNFFRRSLKNFLRIVHFLHPWMRRTLVTISDVQIHRNILPLPCGETFVNCGSQYGRTSRIAVTGMNWATKSFLIQSCSRISFSAPMINAIAVNQIRENHAKRTFNLCLKWWTVHISSPLDFGPCI